MGDFDTIRAMERAAGVQVGAAISIDPDAHRRLGAHACNQELAGRQDRDTTVRLLQMLGLIYTKPGRTPDPDGRLRNN